MRATSCKAKTVASLEAKSGMHIATTKRDDRIAHLGIHLVNLALQLVWQAVDIDGLLWTLALLVPCKCQRQ